MSLYDDPVTVLPEQRCWELVRTQELGRLVTHVGDVVDVFPVNYAVDDEGIIFRTAPGTKLLELTVNADVIFEVDDHTDTEAWSVIMRGRATALESEADIERAENTGLRPWIPTLKRVFVRIEPTRISGRGFRRDPEPERTGVAEY
ncbi:pyridoxamine 5'-phosphate oxidase family protein [Microbacterium sp. 2216-1]|uniref:pyridoxamine 5'-phosphate oxidase family protein n=1 Tax=Microbacterium TaxID=33882 RepID=UPI001CD741CC|nr:pyridoxamine 5'-phosphate oxidase family protein [Microbacterium esteraromaticum]MCA1307640.1 pyridoxamine 5'-phosphate oxidase family protein [Microbacterium esteraromaticum]